MKGKFIVIEGNDGSGKGTQIDLLIEQLKKKGIKKITKTHQPWKKGLRKYIRRRIDENASPDELVRLFLIDRLLHFVLKVGPNLKKGNIVIMDRGKYSTEAYQVSRGASEKKFLFFSKMIEKISGIKKPDVCIIIDVSPEESFERLSKAKRKEKDLKYEKSISELRKNRDKYLEIAKKYPECVVINGSGSKKEVFKRVWKEVEKILKRN